MFGFFTSPRSAGTAWDFTFTAMDGTPLPLAAFEGKAVLIVNTASFCGFTRQYAALQSLWESYRDRGLVVLGVPSNDFGRQEPGSNAQIRDFCETTFSIDFPMTEKVKVTRSDAHPFYRWAGTELGPLAKPRWNFHKYLVGPDGKLVTWFSTITPPRSGRLVSAVERTLPRH
ncbi:MAG TPA: glutathione peroxidase [Arenibaculum sp.]|nr:glutathione peroxidase [Arenibaculum sp.]